MAVSNRVRPTAADDARRRAAEEIYRKMVEAQRDVGDAALCDALDLLAYGTGANKFRHAAAIVRGAKLGRHAIDDREALERIAKFPEHRRREAVGTVARQMAGPDSSRAAIEAIERRLRRKIKRTNWFCPPARIA